MIFRRQTEVATTIAATATISTDDIPERTTKSVAGISGASKSIGTREYDENKTDTLE
jgi:hypothetical protein